MKNGECVNAVVIIIRPTGKHFAQAVVDALIMLICQLLFALLETRLWIFIEQSSMILNKMCVSLVLYNVRH